MDKETGRMEDEHTDAAIVGDIGGVNDSEGDVIGIIDDDSLGSFLVRFSRTNQNGIIPFVVLMPNASPGASVHV